MTTGTDKVFEVSGAQATVLEIQPLRHAKRKVYGIGLPVPSLESKEFQSAIRKQEFVEQQTTIMWYLEDQ